MEVTLSPVVIRCEFTVGQLDLIETALNQMCWRDQSHKENIRRTLASVQMQKRFGDVKKEAP